MTRHDSASSTKSKVHDVSYDSRKQQPEVSSEKQKLAASLLGGESKSDRKPSHSGQKALKTNNHGADKDNLAKAASL